MAKKIMDPLWVKLNEKYLKGLDNKTDAEQNAIINVNFINGKQYIRYNKELQIIEDIKFEDSSVYREKEVFNKIRSFRNTIKSKVKDKIPEPQVIAYTEDDQDLDASKATNAMLKDLFNRQKVNKKLLQAATDTIDIGPAFLHVKWNPQAGEVLMSDLNALLGDTSALLTEEEKIEIKKKLDSSDQLRTGDVEIEFVKMYEMLVGDPFEQDIQEQPWIMRVKSYKCGEANEIFGKDFKQTEAIGRISKQRNGLEYNSKILTDNLNVYNSERIEEAIVAKEYFEKPTAKRPRGRYVLFVGEYIIKDEDLPYINGEYGTRTYPFIKMGLDTPSLFYSQAFIEDLKPIQKRYNEIRNRKYEQIVKNVHGVLAVAIGSIPEDQVITNKPGSILFYNRNFPPPTSLKATSSTLDVDSEINSLNNEFVSVPGISTLSTTGTPQSSGVRGSGMVEQLMESDESKFSLITDVLIEAVIELSKQTIRLYKQFMMPGEVRFTRFTKDLSSVINWNSDLLVEDIDIKNRSQLSMTPTRKKQDVETLLQSGLLTTESGYGADMAMKMIEQMELGFPINEIPIKGIDDVKKARRENSLIVNHLATIDADEYDDHTIHYNIHTNYIKSSEYRKLIIANPQMDQVMRAHIKQHSDIVQAQQQSAQAQAIAEKNSKG